MYIQLDPANYYGVCVGRPAESCALNSAISMPSLSLIASYSPVSGILSAVMHIFSRVREEQVQLVSFAVGVYSVRERMYILKMYYQKKNCVSDQGENVYRFPDRPVPCRENHTKFSEKV